MCFCDATLQAYPALCYHNLISKGCSAVGPLVEKLNQHMEFYAGHNPLEPDAEAVASAEAQLGVASWPVGPGDCSTAAATEQRRRE